MFQLLLSLLTIFFINNSAKSAPQKEENLQKREEMVTISSHLGVTCTYCHVTDNFRLDSKPPFKIALDHIRITHLINEQGFKGKIKATCFMCHRGKAKPDYEPKNH